MVSWYTHDMIFLLEKRIVTSVADPDPHGHQPSAWIRIKVKSRIRIHIVVKKGDSGFRSVSECGSAALIVKKT
jgi:hypothetical protein